MWYKEVSSKGRGLCGDGEHMKGKKLNVKWEAVES